MNRTIWLAYIIGVLSGAIGAMVLMIAYFALVPAEPEQNDLILAPIDPGTGVNVIESQDRMPDFVLTDLQDQPIHLYDLPAQPTLMAFGFTHCPDVCPLTLQEMREIRSSLNDDGDKLNYLFISVDGERDTPEVLHNYFTQLRVDSFVIGMTGTLDEVSRMGTSYGLYVAHGEPDDNGNYDVEHTAGYYLLDSEHRWIRRYNFGTDLSFIISDLRQIIDQTND